MTPTTRRPAPRRRTRTVQRAVHLITALPVLAYVYLTPDAADPQTWAVRFVAVPVLVLTGVVMWQAPRLRRLRARQART